MYLKRWRDLQWRELPRIEHPSRACQEVERAFDDPYGCRVHGIDRLLHDEAPRTWSQARDRQALARLLERMRRGEAFLVHGVSKPSRPVVRAGSDGKWRVDLPEARSPLRLQIESVIQEIARRQVAGASGGGNGGAATAPAAASSHDSRRRASSAPGPALSPSQLFKTKVPIRPAAKVPSASSSMPATPKVQDKVDDINPGKMIGGRKIINSDLAGTVVRTKGGDVRFDRDGFPDFTPYSVKTVRVQGLTGDMANDVILAMDKAGMTTYDKSKYVWHHHQDAKTMMLVPKDVHSVRNGGVAHTGGRAVIQHNLNNPDNPLNYPSPAERR